MFQLKNLCQFTRAAFAVTSKLVSNVTRALKGARCVGADMGTSTTLITALIYIWKRVSSKDFAIESLSIPKKMEIFLLQKHAQNAALLCTKLLGSLTILPSFTYHLPYKNSVFVQRSMLIMAQEY